MFVAVAVLALAGGGLYYLLLEAAGPAAPVRAEAGRVTRATPAKVLFVAYGSGHVQDGRAVGAGPGRQRSGGTRDAGLDDH